MHKYDINFFQKLPNCVQKWLCCFTLPPKVYEISSFSIPLLCIIVSLLDYSHSNVYEAIFA